MLKFLVLLLALLLLLCVSCVGCVSCVSCRIIGHWLDEAKEVFHLNEEDVTRICNGETDYTILDETVSREELGEWIGTIRQIAVVDEQGKILKQKPFPMQSVSSYADLADGITAPAFVIPFLNVYRAPDGQACLYVEVNGAFHKAVDSGEITDDTVRFHFQEGYIGKQEHKDMVTACN